jgi:hypothetical protein
MLLAIVTVIVFIVVVVIVVVLGIENRALHAGQVLCH